MFLYLLDAADFDDFDDADLDLLKYQHLVQWRWHLD